MSATERLKGANGEREVVQMLRAHGWMDAHRSSDGRSQRTRGDIAAGPANVHFEVRRRERAEVWAWVEQAEQECKPGDLWVVPFRRSRSTWKALVELDALLSLLEGYEL